MQDKDGDSMMLIYDDPATKPQIYKRSMFKFTIYVKALVLNTLTAENSGFHVDKGNLTFPQHNCWRYR